ncbi:ABC transporter ATP-binding protein [Vibrio gazogenes]|uniref:ABC transporter ATP-binding protein n=1 Tax=Vibrio gazogenes TaxID=687 RepID=UPI0013564C95|nr:ABC transporter ATP-binding protein [Vibrio gazogenes]USP14022.1 ABC transporter ATP-binding protein [Vibrio gazogenes]
MSAKIELTNICKSYPEFDNHICLIKELLHPFKKKYSKDVKILDHISLSINRNEVVGIIGRNGAGKSTLLKIISGVLSPDEGEIEVEGRITALLELGAAFNPEYTGKENIYFYGATQGLSRSKIDEIYNEIVTFADIGDYIDQPVKNYSSGMFARLAFSSAVHLVPDILIVDETLAVGDVFFQNKCIKKMQELIKKGSTVIFVSHDMHAVKFFCDRIIYLKNGRIEIDSYDVTEALDLYENGKLITPSEKETTCNSNIIEIVDTYFTDKFGNKKHRYKVSESINVVIEYEVLEEGEDLFLGFGIRNKDNVYVFGVNSKLDNIDIPLSLGKHRIILSLNENNLYKSIYNCWSVVYNSSGTVALSTLTMKSAFEIYNNTELCEGIVNPSRTWTCEKNED